MGTMWRFVDPVLYNVEKLRIETFTTTDKPPNTVQNKKPIKTSDLRWPVVRFQIPAGTREMMVVPETWKVELPSGEILHLVFR